HRDHPAPHPPCRRLGDESRCECGRPRHGIDRAGSKPPAREQAGQGGENLDDTIADSLALQPTRPAGCPPSLLELLRRRLSAVGAMLTVSATRDPLPNRGSEW